MISGMPGQSIKIRDCPGQSGRMACMFYLLSGIYGQYVSGFSFFFFLITTQNISSKKVFENTVGKGETACNEQFLHFPHCFLTIARTFYAYFQI